METKVCVARFKSGKKKGQQCSHPATNGTMCGLHAPKPKNEKKKKQQQQQHSLTDWLLKVMMGCHPREGEEEASDDTEVAATANDNNAPAPVPGPGPARQCIEAGRLPLRARTGCSGARFVGTMPVDNAVYVCNVAGSSADKGSWKTFCSRYLATVGEEYPKVCRVKDCQRKVTATGHMYWRDCKGAPDGWRYNYLAGICSHHNSSVYDTKYVPLKKGHVVIIEENPVVQQRQQNPKKGRKKK